MTVSELYRKRELLLARLRQLKKHGGEEPTSTGQTSSVHAGLDSEISTLERQKHRRRSVDLKTLRGSRDTDHLLTLAATLENGTPLEHAQVVSLKALLEKEIQLLSDALGGQFSSQNHYPRNLTIRNFCDFITLPIVVYELEYPRTDRVNWVYVLEKTAATFGTIVVMIVVSQSWIYPVVMSTVRMKEEGLTVQQRLREFPWVLSDLLFPFMMEYLLAFYVIWECVVR